MDDQLDLSLRPPTPWMDPPKAPAASVEQVTLTLDRGTIEGRYRAWLATPEGQEAFVGIERRILADVAGGATRVSVNLVVELVRGSPPHPRIDNSFRALMARDLRAKYSELKTIIEIRQRGAV